MTLYKVLDKNDHIEGAAFRVSDHCYSKWVSVTKTNANFYDNLFAASNRTGLGIDAFVIMAKDFRNVGYDTSRIFGDIRMVPTKRISLMYGDKYEVDTVSRGEIDQFAELCLSSGVEFSTRRDVLMLWEHLFEGVRCKSYPDAPSRFTSYFAFRELDDARKYAQEKTGRLICELDDSHSIRSFEADMAMIDTIPNYFTHAQVASIMQRYWAGALSASPSIEVLLGGELVLGRAIL